MISVEEASQIVQANIPCWIPDSLAENLLSDRSYPPFDRVMMDGIAINSSNFHSGQRKFKIEGVCPAGETTKKLLDTKSCLEVMTGAPLPKGCDLVIPYEHLQIDQGNAEIINEIPREQFENIHPAGSDCQKDEIVLWAGASLNGPHIGIATSIGREFSLKQSPKIMIISTGDELVDKWQTPLPHQIRRSNAYALQTSLNLFGFNNIVLDHLSDEAQVVANHYLKYSPDFDLMIYSGGVSKGKFDYLPNVWSDLGVKKLFHEVAQRPGKPLWFGTDQVRNTAVVGLPGNPVSSLVCLHRYFLNNRNMFVQLSEEIIFKKDLTYFLPVRISFERNGHVVATPLKIKNSGDFTALAGSDGFIELPREQSIFKKGEAFAFYSWKGF